MFAYISGLKKNEQLFERLSLVLLAVLLVITPIVYMIVPEKVLILSQKDAGGLDSYNNKSALWLFPLIGIIIYAALSIQKYYLIKYREAPAKGQEPEHTTTVWILRMVKAIAMAGLIISVVEVLSGASEPGSAMVMGCYAVELIIVAGVFTLAFKEVLSKYGKK
ncbi:MAG: hypothetical protein KDC07_00775 [Chitinophagaceae bacterium]|nr:hypothetical protein [Chitinophagaceae bacterium]MCB9044629.1 hypothetical protein [Chitinophagales bacterium]